MELTFEWWWTNRRTSELRFDGEQIRAAGMLPGVVDLVAENLGLAVEWRDDPDDEYGRLFRIGSVEGRMHDDCFMNIGPASEPVLAALLAAVLSLHEAYLGLKVDKHSAVLELAACWRDGHTARIKSDRRLRCVSARVYGLDAGFLARRRAAKLSFPAR